MPVPARRPATYEDILALPDHVIGEIIDGELVVSPRPAPQHADAASSLGGILIPPFRFGDGGPGGWRILFEPELHLGEHVLVPDLAGWRLDRMPALPDEAFFTLAPDWVCEVLSPGTSRMDRTRKLPIYARVGVSHLWLIDPLLQTLEVFALQDGRWVLLGTHGGDESVSVKPFEDAVIQLSRLWGRDAAVSPVR
jgi:Uma2 family endonuclease